MSQEFHTETAGQGAQEALSLKGLNPVAAPSLRDRLLADTEDIHKKAEHNPFNHRLFTPRLTMAEYLENLVVLRLLHKCYEEHFDEVLPLPLVEATPKLSSLAQCDIRHIESKHGLMAPEWTLKDLGIDIHSIPTSKEAVLGAFYTLKGSTNGNMIAAANINRAFGLTRQEGLSFLDALADMPAPRPSPVMNSAWKALAAKIDEFVFDEAQYEDCLFGAHTAFRIFDESATAATKLSQL